MKKNIFCLFFVLAVLTGLILSSCGEIEELENGIGTVILLNNSSNVIIGYWSLEKNRKMVWDTHSFVYPRSSGSHQIDSGYYSIYLEEDVTGYGWITKNTLTVKKDETVEIKFPSDFIFLN